MAKRLMFLREFFWMPVIVYAFGLMGAVLCHVSGTGMGGTGGIYMGFCVIFMVAMPFSMAFSGFYYEQIALSMGATRREIFVAAQLVILGMTVLSLPAYPLACMMTAQLPQSVPVPGLQQMLGLGVLSVTAGEMGTVAMVWCSRMQAKVRSGIRMGSVIITGLVCGVSGAGAGVQVVFEKLVCPPVMLVCAVLIAGGAAMCRKGLEKEIVLL